MPVYEVEVNGKAFEIDAPKPPTRVEAQQYVSRMADPQAPPLNPMTMLGRPLKPEVAAQIQRMTQQEQQRTNSGYEDIKGLAKSALGTIEGGGKLIRSIPVVGPLLSRGPEVQVPFSSTPSSPEQAHAKAIGDVAQFFIPAAGVAKIKTALTTGVGVLDGLVGGALEGSSAAGVQAAQQGNTKGTGTTALVTGASSLAIRGGLKAAGWLGERIEQALVKPTIADVRGGFKVSNIFKYKLGGTLSQSFDKTQAKLTDLSGQLQTALSHPLGQRAPQIDVLQALTDASVDLSAQSARNFGSNKAIEGAVTKLLDDPIFQGVAATGKVDLATANHMKQAVGELGAWLHDPSGRVLVDPDSKAMETVANTLYAKLKTAIEQGAVGPVASVNKQLSEVIPIRLALIRRIPVEQRQNMMNLGDIVGMSTGQWGISLANRVLKSGRAANAAVTMSQHAPAIAGTVAPAVGAGMRQLTETR